MRPGAHSRIASSSSVSAMSARCFSCSARLRASSSRDLCIALQVALQLLGQQSAYCRHRAEDARALAASSRHPCRPLQSSRPAAAAVRAARRTSSPLARDDCRVADGRLRHSRRGQRATPAPAADVGRALPLRDGVRPPGGRHWPRRSPIAGLACCCSHYCWLQPSRARRTRTPRQSHVEEVP